MEIAIILVEHGAYTGTSLYEAVGNIITQARMWGKEKFADEMERFRGEMRLDVLAQAYDFYDMPDRPANNRLRKNGNQQNKNHVGNLGRDPWEIIMKNVHIEW